MIGSRISRFSRIFLFSILIVLLFGRSTPLPGDQTEGVRAFTREIEFDYIGWTLDALRLKINQAALGTANYLPEASRREIVLDYLELVSAIQQEEAIVNAIYANPEVSDPERESAAQRARLEQLYARRSNLGPLAEAILQSQLAQVVADLGMALGGQPIPPILFHSTPLPPALIISPRDTIHQDANISLIPELTIDERVALEDEIDQALNVSSLVVGIGGVGVYPTMVMQTSDLNWLSEVVAHEWIHNFLTLRPLGINYFTTPELRVMNETTATIAGKEISGIFMQAFYPELMPPPPPEIPQEPFKQRIEPPVFDFRAEMHTTRLEVDRLLAEGQVEAAEDYMETRRVLFWENGYRIRKLNQAYFAFYGAYADQPGGPAGEDPVGAAVRALRAQSKSLAVFVNQISWMSSLEQLQRAVASD